MYNGSYAASNGRLQKYAKRTQSFTINQLLTYNRTFGDHSVDFVVEDCGFDNLKDLLTYQCKVLRKIPSFPTMFFARIFYKLITKSSFNDANPERMISTCDDIPMLFIHGDKDDFVPAYMVYKCYDAKNGFKMVKTFDCSIHARVVVEHKDEYAICLKDFLEKANVIFKKSCGNNF